MLTDFQYCADQLIGTLKENCHDHMSAFLSLRELKDHCPLSRQFSLVEFCIFEAFNISCNLSVDLKVTDE